MLAACAVLFAAGGSTACLPRDEPRTEKSGRAAWVWSRAAWMDERDRLELVHGARRLGLTELYVFLSLRADAERISELAELAALADAEGIDVAWVAGDPSWAGANGRRMRRAAVETLGRLRTELLRRGIDTGSRVQFDVEPYLLPDWPREQGPIVARYLAAVDELVDGAHALGLEAWFVIPFWYERIPTPEGQPLHERVIDRADGVVVMAYRNSGGEMIAVAQSELRYAEHVGISAVLAVETKCLDPSRTSYCTRGAEALSADLSLVEEALSSSSSFGGIAIHDIDGLLALERDR